MRQPCREWGELAGKLRELAGQGTETWGTAAGCLLLQDIEVMLIDTNHQQWPRGECCLL